MTFLTVRQFQFSPFRKRETLSARRIRRGFFSRRGWGKTPLVPLFTKGDEKTQIREGKYEIKTGSQNPPLQIEKHSR